MADIPDQTREVSLLAINVGRYWKALLVESHTGRERRLNMATSRPTLNDWCTSVRRYLKKGNWPLAVTIHNWDLAAHHGVRDRRTCSVAACFRSMYRHRSRRDPRTALGGKIREIRDDQVRYGYRVIHILLDREGRDVINWSRTELIARKSWSCAASGPSATLWQHSKTTEPA